MVLLAMALALGGRLAPGKWSADEQTAAAAELAQQLLTRPALLTAGTSSKDYACVYCGCRFAKLKMYSQHLAGKRHAKNVERADAFWSEYGSADHGDDVKRAIESEFDLTSFLEGLPGSAEIILTFEFTPVLTLWVSPSSSSRCRPIRNWYQI